MLLCYTSFSVFVWFPLYHCFLLSNALRAPSRHVPWTCGREGLRGGWEGFKINEESSQVWINPLSKPPEELKERLLEPSGDPLGGLGVSGGRFLRFLVRSGGDFWRSWREDVPKMDARWAKLAASCAQDGPWWRQDRPLELSLEAFGVLGAFLVTFFAIFAKMAEV